MEHLRLSETCWPYHYPKEYWCSEHEAVNKTCEQIPKSSLPSTGLNRVQQLSESVYITNTQ